MPDLPQLTAAVQRNCDIADAVYAQRYSLCTYLLKMREFYRWQRGAALTATLGHEEVGAWLSEQEERWQAIENEDFRRIPVDDTLLDPFDIDGINAALLPRGLVYSGGIGRHGQPHFFVADLLRVEQHGEIRAYVADTEHARDASAPPAMLSGDTIFVRRDTLRRTLWEGIEEWHSHRRAGPMQRLLATYDFDARPQGAIEQLADHEVGAAILHELGEHAAGGRLGAEWQRLLARAAGTAAELTVRAVRDHLADCLVTLPTLVERRDEASLLWWLVNLRAVRRQLYPQAVEVFSRWLRSGRIDTLRSLGERGADHWLDCGRLLLDLHHAHARDDRALVSAIGAAPIALQ